MREQPQKKGPLSRMMILLSNPKDGRFVHSRAPEDKAGRIFPQVQTGVCHSLYHRENSQADANCVQAGRALGIDWLKPL